MKMYTLVIILTMTVGIGIASANAPGRGEGRGGAGGRGVGRGAAGSEATPQPGTRGERIAAARAGRAGRAERAGRGAEARVGRGGRAGRGNATPEERIDKREQVQDKRIEHGIKKGQLTPDEVTKLRGLEDNIQSMEDQFKSDGKLNRNEARQLGKALNEASLQIWAERHDTEGKQKPVVRLGKDVVALDELTAKIESGDMNKADARKFLGDFHKMVNLKRRLSSDDLSGEQRTKLQAEYNELLNRYFATKTP